MQPSSNLGPRSRLGGLFALCTIGLLLGTDALAQNLDEGKSGARLFADSCVTCHRSPRSLAKGRYRVALFAFLREHYASNASTAWELASYLASVETPQRGRSRTSTASSSRAGSTAASALRPPRPVPQR
jgi:mono/diheme cytochrome c family protein